MSKLLALSAGHYLYTSGKRIPACLDPNQTREWQLNARIAEHLQKILDKYDGIEILRLDDPKGIEKVLIETRTAKTNKANADFYLAIHHNAGINLGLGGGVVVYHYPLARNKEQATKLYKCITNHNHLIGNRSIPVKSTVALWEVSAPKADALLIENGFMDSTTDAPIILQDSFAKATAEGIAEFFIDMWGLTKKDQAVTEDKKEDETKNVYIVKKGDTLSKIAKAHNTTYQKIAQVNGIKAPYKIYVGQEIIIP